MSRSGQLLLKEDMFCKRTESYLANIKKMKNVIIWGAGSAGAYILDFLKENNASENIKFFTDRDDNKQGKYLDEYLIISPNKVQEYTKLHPDTFIIIGTRFSGVKEQIMSLGVREENIDTIGFNLVIAHVNCRNRTSLANIKSKLSELDKVYSMLEDEQSKLTYINLLNYRISMDTSYLTKIANPTEEQYFDPELI